MKKFTLILIVVALIVLGYVMFSIGLFLLKVFAGLFVASLIALGAYVSYLVTNKLRK